MRWQSAAIVVCIGLVSACATSTGAPVRPASSPTATYSGDVCFVGGTASSQPADGLVTVSADPISAVAIWIPGMNSKECQIVRTPIAQPAALKLATDIRTAPEFPKGTINCPSDDGTRVVLDFSYHGKASQEAVADLAGCSMVEATGRASRQLTRDLRRDLAPVAPPAWISFVQ
jgi:hypothetical protein